MDPRKVESKKYEDPLEAFRKKKEVEVASKNTQSDFKVNDDGRPKGFMVHRYNYGTGIPAVDVAKPRGFDRGRFENQDKPVPNQLKKPKKFTKDRMSE